MKKVICTLLAVLLLTALGCGAYADSGSIGVEAGQTMPDFTVPLTDGTSIALSGLLREKDLVVLNIFATWCGPCEYEFPEMEKSYRAHSDRMEILSLSGDADDTMEMVADYKAAHGLSFPMGRTDGALDFLRVSGYPTTVFITRDGTIGFIKVGAFVNEGEFEEKVGVFLSDAYHGEVLPSEIAQNRLSLLLALPVLGLLLVIARWRLFRKAGKPGWHSLIPILSDCEEFALGWKGGLGLLFVLCQIGLPTVLLAESHPNWAVLVSAVCALCLVILKLAESVKLAKAFGRKTGAGILLWLTGALGRFVLGVSRASYRGPGGGTPDIPAQEM